MKIIFSKLPSSFHPTKLSLCAGYPKIEVDLCGHATLAAAFVLFTECGFTEESVGFNPRSGALTDRSNSDLLTFDFPLQPALPWSPPGTLARGWGQQPLEII